MIYDYCVICKLLHKSAFIQYTLSDNNRKISFFTLKNEKYNFSLLFIKLMQIICGDRNDGIKQGNLAIKTNMSLGVTCMAHAYIFCLLLLVGGGYKEGQPFLKVRSIFFSSFNIIINLHA